MPSAQNWTEALGVVVRKRRQQAGLTQERLAAAAELTRNAIQNIEGGKTRLSFVNFVLLAEALHANALEMMQQIEALASTPDKLKRALEEFAEERVPGRPAISRRVR